MSKKQKLCVALLWVGAGIVCFITLAGIQDLEKPLFKTATSDT
jgi:hypothetical protein